MLVHHHHTSQDLFQQLLPHTPLQLNAQVSYLRLGKPLLQGNDTAILSTLVGGNYYSPLATIHWVAMHMTAVGKCA